MRTLMSVLFLLMAVSAEAKKKPPVMATETGKIVSIEFINQSMLKFVQYSIHGSDIDFEAAQPGRTMFSGFPEPIAKIGDEVHFSITKNYAYVEGTRMMLMKSTRRPK